MVAGSRPTLQRLLRIRKQKAMLLQMNVMKIETEIRVQRQLIDQIQQQITVCSESPANGWALEKRSHWITHSLQKSADIEVWISELNETRQTIEAERQQIERDAEALSRFIERQIAIERQERSRIDQVRLDDILITRTIDRAQNSDEGYQA